MERFSRALNDLHPARLFNVGDSSSCFQIPVTPRGVNVSEIFELCREFLEPRGLHFFVTLTRTSKSHSPSVQIIVDRGGCGRPPIQKGNSNDGRLESLAEFDEENFLGGDTTCIQTPNGLCLKCPMDLDADGVLELNAVLRIVERQMRLFHPEVKVYDFEEAADNIQTVYVSLWRGESERPVEPLKRHVAVNTVQPRRPPLTRILGNVLQTTAAFLIVDKILNLLWT